MGRGGGRPYSTPPLAVAHPEVAAQWHPTLNGDRTPATTASRAARRVWWRCPAGSAAYPHDWEAKVQNRAAGGGCPFCAGRRVHYPGSVAALRPDLLATWHPTRNAGLDPAAIPPGSEAKAWWVCPRGHEWQAGVDKRVKGTGCRVCAGKAVDPGRSLAARWPALAAQWHPTRNAALTPADVLPGHSGRVWWRCSRGHVWLTAPAQRARVGGTGCPGCAHRGRRNVPLEVAAPELLAEWVDVLNGGRGNDVPAGRRDLVWWQCPDVPAHLYRSGVAGRARQRFGCPYCSGRRPCPTNNLAAVHPRVAVSWHPTLNGELSPTDVLPASHVLAVWRCQVCGYGWSARVAWRTSGGTGCPCCAAAGTTRCLPLPWPGLTDAGGEEPATAPGPAQAPPG